MTAFGWRWMAGLLCWAATADGFIHAQIGQVIPNRDMPALSGGTHPLLSNTTVNVFLFIRPGQEYTHLTLQRVAQLEKDFAGKPVHWVSVVSDRFTKEQAAAEVKQTGISMPVLIDTGDDLYGELGVALTPVVGITDATNRLVAYQPFAKVNFTEILRARIQHQLKEITEAQLEDVLKPPPVTMGDDAEKARRRLRLAEKQFASGSHEKAWENLKASFELDKNSAAAHLLHGKILATQGKNSEALEAFDRALALEPGNAAAQAARDECVKKGK